ncbi:MAG: hypothetical protein MUO68_08270 [Desulfobacteraceae bacterium]|nr:hypothetical protein [Desulfobacteraceae bacterium]
MSEWRDTDVSSIAASVRNALVGGPFGSNNVRGVWYLIAESLSEHSVDPAIGAPLNCKPFHWG